MALIKCKKCGHIVSDKAEECPKCGYPVSLSLKEEKEQPQRETVRAENDAARQKQGTYANGQTPYNKRKDNEGKNGQTSFLAIALVVVLICFIGYVVISKNSSQNDVQPVDYAATESMPTGQNTGDETESYGDNPNVESTFADTANIDDEEEHIVNAIENVTLRGTMTDENGDNPIELSFDTDGYELSNCIYTNVALGGKIRMSGKIVGNELVFTGKDGRNKFQIRIDKDCYDGMATDGPKMLIVSLTE